MARLSRASAQVPRRTPAPWREQTRVRAGLLTSGLMDRRRANLLQGGALLAFLIISSRDVERTMQQQPVSEEQKQAPRESVDSRPLG